MLCLDSHVHISSRTPGQSCLARRSLVGRLYVACKSISLVVPTYTLDHTLPTRASIRKWLRVRSNLCTSFHLYEFVCVIYVYVYMDYLLIRSADVLTPVRKRIVMVRGLLTFGEYNISTIFQKLCIYMCVYCILTRMTTVI